MKDITAQLNLTLAVDQVDVAREIVFVESRKKELLAAPSIIDDALFEALRGDKSQFVELLIDQDLSAELDFHSFLTVRVLRTLYRNLASCTHPQLPRSICDRLM